MADKQPLNTHLRIIADSSTCIWTLSKWASLPFAEDYSTFSGIVYVCSKGSSPVNVVGCNISGVQNQDRTHL